MSDTPSIECAKDGPYMVTGVSTFKNSAGEAIETKEKMYLCRCGASKNKPFCDGSHSKTGFSGDAT